MSKDSLVTQLLSLHHSPEALAELLAFGTDVPSEVPSSSLTVTVAQAKQAAKMPVARAAYHAAVVDSAEALAVFVKDARIAVRAAAASNPRLTADQFLVLWKRSVDKRESAVFQALLAAMHPDVAIADLLAASPQATRVMGATHSTFGALTSVQALSLLASEDPSLCRKALSLIAQGRVDVPWEEAVETATRNHCSLAVCAATAWTRATPLTTAHARTIAHVCARQEVFPNANGRLARCEIEPAAAEIIAASGPLGLALLAPHYAQMPASVAAQLAASAAAVDKLPFGSLLPEHIELVVSTFERELSDGDSAFHTAATKFVCVSKLLSVDQQARLLRLLTLDALQGLLSTYGDHSPSVTRELLRQLADDPGTAFQSDRRTLFQLLTWKEACWYGAELETALLDLIPGWYAHCVRERLMSRRGLEHLAQSVQEGILGDDHSWGTVVELSESWAGTLPELIQLVSSAIQDL